MQLLFLVMMQAYLYLCQQKNSPSTSNTSSYNVQITILKQRGSGY